MVENASMTNFEKIAKIIKSNGGYVTGRDVSEANIPTSILSQYIKKYNLIKQCPGFYSTEDWMADDYFIFQYQYTKLIYSFYGAAYLHRLGDFIPTSLEATGPKNYRPFPLPRARTARPAVRVPLRFLLRSFRTLRIIYFVFQHFHRSENHRPALGEFLLGVD